MKQALTRKSVLNPPQPTPELTLEESSAPMPRRSLRAFAHDATGSVAIIAPFFALMSVGGMALAVNSGNAYYTQLKLQNIATAAATGGVLAVLSEPTSVTAKALDLVTRNTPSDFGTVAKSADVRVGKWDKSTQTFTATTEDPNAVEVTTHRSIAYGNPLGVFFGNLLGRSTLDLHAASIAMVYGSPACAVVLDPNGSGAFTVGGSSTVKANCTIHVNSTASGAAQTSGSGRVNVGRVCTRGTITGSGWGSTQLRQGTAQCPMLADPLAAVPEPVNPGGCHTPPNGASTLAPGCYTGTIKLSGNIKLAPGFYYFKDARVSVNSKTSITGTGVRLYVDATSHLDLSGGSDVNLTADTSSAQQTGILIFGSRSATTGGNVTLGGGGQLDLNGTLYTPSSTLSLSGSSTLTQGNRTGVIITKRLSVSGSSTLALNGFPSGANAASTRLRSSIVQ
nr:TadG family pilus assembly protein [Methylobacterium sp. L1A1]